MLIYFGILIAASIEGEVAYLAAATSSGRAPEPIGVIAAGASGAALGDQFYFYLLRGRLQRWSIATRPLRAAARRWSTRSAAMKRR